jgi:hypothetical protein
MCLIAACASALLVFPENIRAQNGVDHDPFVVVTAGQERYVVPLQTEGKTTGFNHTIETAEYEINISGTLDPDPSIAYAIGVTDFGAPSIFGFLFGTPIVPTVSPTLVSGSVVGGLTDFTGDGVSLSPIPGPKLQSSSAGFPLTSTSVDVGDPAVHPAGAPGAFYAYGPFADGPKPGPAGGPWTFLTVTAGFSLSGGSDSAALTGFTSIDTAPARVPDGGVGILGTLALLAVLAGGRVARQNARA